MPEADLTFDMKDFERAADNIGAARDQLPFVVSQLINTALFNTRRVLVESSWPRSVKVHNEAFMNWALRVDKSYKYNLNGAIYDGSKRNIIERHASGGIKQPYGAAYRLAIPVKGTVEYGPRGVPRKKRVGYLLKHTPKKALRVTNKGVFVAEKGRLHLKYSFRSTSKTPKDANLYEDFVESMVTDMEAGFDSTMRRAMETRW